MITWTKRLLLTCTILGQLATNVLTLTSSVLNAAISGFMSTAMGVATVTKVLQSKIAKKDWAIKRRKAVTRKLGNTYLDNRITDLDEKSQPLVCKYPDIHSHTAVRRSRHWRLAQEYTSPSPGLPVVSSVLNT
jgi:hypothetical protein